MEDLDKRIHHYFLKLLDHQDLCEREAYDFLDCVALGKVSLLKIAVFLTALSIKGEIFPEILGFAKAMRKHAIHFPEVQAGDEPDKKWDYPFVDTCGTGGDNKNTFNISTITAFVVAGCGVPVLKHGNRSVSSSCGSADFLEAMGLEIDSTIEQTQDCLRQCHFAFLFAPAYHPAMKYVVPVRKELRIRTIFNLLGPLTNPGLLKHQFVGVFSADVQEKIAQSLKGLGVQNFMVVHSEDGMDEASIFAKNNVLESFQGGELSHRIVDPADYGFFYKKKDYEKILVRNIEDNLYFAKSILAGEKGAARDIVLLNAGCVLMVAGAVSDIKKGISLAADCIDDGRVLRIYEKLCHFAQKKK